MACPQSTSAGSLYQGLCLLDVRSGLTRLPTRSIANVVSFRSFCVEARNFQERARTGVRQVEPLKVRLGLRQLLFLLYYYPLLLGFCIAGFLRLKGLPHGYMCHSHSFVLRCFCSQGFARLAQRFEDYGGNSLKTHRIPNPPWGTYKPSLLLVVPFIHRSRGRPACSQEQGF